ETRCVIGALCKGGVSWPNIDVASHRSRRPGVIRNGPSFGGSNGPLRGAPADLRNLPPGTRRHRVLYRRNAGRCRPPSGGACLTAVVVELSAVGARARCPYSGGSRIFIISSEFTAPGGGYAGSHTRRGDRNNRPCGEAPFVDARSHSVAARFFVRAGNCRRSGPSNLERRIQSRPGSCG